MKHKLFFSILVAFCIVFGMTAAATAQYGIELEVTTDGSTAATGPFAVGDDIYLNIIATEAQKVAGCAFTLVYPSNLLTPPTPKTYNDASTPPGEISVDSSDISSVFPFTFTYPSGDYSGTTRDTHRVNTSESGKIYFSGAAIDTTNGGSKYTSSGEVVLFTVKFVAAAAGTSSFELQQTALHNPAAGYGNDADPNSTDTVPILVGAEDNSNSTLFNDFDCTDGTCAFPVLLDSFSTNPTAAFEISGGGTPTPTNVDSDGDGIDDGLETGYFGNLTSVDATTDSDGDGYLDSEEMPTGTLKSDPTNADDTPGFIVQDFNLDGSIGLSDLTGLLQYWQVNDSQGIWNARYNIDKTPNGSNQQEINLADLTLFLQYWGSTE